MVDILMQHHDWERNVCATAQPLLSPDHIFRCFYLNAIMFCPYFPFLSVLLPVSSDRLIQIRTAFAPGTALLHKKWTFVKSSFCCNHRCCSRNIPTQQILNVFLSKSYRLQIDSSGYGQIDSSRLWLHNANNSISESVKLPSTVFLISTVIFGITLFKKI